MITRVTWIIILVFYFVIISIIMGMVGSSFDVNDSTNSSQFNNYANSENGNQLKSQSGIVSFITSILTGMSVLGWEFNTILFYIPATILLILIALLFFPLANAGA